MLGFHEKLIEVQGPDPQILVFRTRDTEGLVDCNGVDGRVIRPIRRLQRLIIIVYLIDHACLARDIDASETVFLGSVSSCL